MASKSKATYVASKNSSKAAKGTNYTTAQWKAYTKASSATYNKMSQNVQAKALQKYRLQAANKTIARNTVVVNKAKTASIAAYAAKRSYRQATTGHQNAALKARVYADYFGKNTLLGRAQFAQAGERMWTAHAVLRTMTNAQALKSVQVKASAAAKKASTTKKTRGTNSATSRTIAAASAKAGAAAASKLPGKARTASTYEDQGSKWIQQPPNTCIATAIANTLLMQTGITMEASDIERIYRYSGRDLSTIYRALLIAQDMGDWSGWHLHFKLSSTSSKGDIIGYRTQYGDHAAVFLGDGLAATWGDEEAVDSEIEESWEIVWSRP